MLLSFLKEFHTDGQGSIMISDSLVTLRMTADLIREDSSIDYDCMVEQLLESDEIKSFCESLVNQRIDDALKCVVDADDLSEKNLIETIERLLRAD